MTYVQVSFTDRADWLTKRRTGIGASDIAAIIGISPWSTIFQTWVSKMSDDAPEIKASEDMEWGLRMEGLIIEEALDRLVNPLRYPPLSEVAVHYGALLRSTIHPWMLATPDALVTIGEPFVIEAKKTGDWSWDEVPAHYVAQIQWQMAVSGAETGYVAALHQGRRLEIYTIEADLDLQAELISEGEAFWKLVETNTPPPVGAADNSYLASLWPTHVEAAVEISAELASELYAARSAMKEAKSRVAAVEAALKEEMQEADTAVVDQTVVATWRTQPANRIDTKMLRAEDPDIAVAYSKTTTSRVLRVKEPKT